MLTVDLKQAVKTIKAAILQSQGRAARMISGTQLSLYFGVGLYVSANSRKGTWGTGAIKAISEQLQRELPGLRGFSEESIKKMRTFAEFWHHYLNRSPTATDLETLDTQSVITYDHFSLQKWWPFSPFKIRHTLASLSVFGAKLHIFRHTAKDFCHKLPFRFGTLRHIRIPVVLLVMVKDI